MRGNALTVRRRLANISQGRSFSVQSTSVIWLEGELIACSSDGLAAGMSTSSPFVGGKICQQEPQSLIRLQDGFLVWLAYFQRQWPHPS